VVTLGAPILASSSGNDESSGDKQASSSSGSGNDWQATNTAVSQADLDTLAANGVKFTPQNVLATGTTPSGQTVFLETGSPSSGLQHIVDEHANDFANIGVPESQIPNVVMQAVTEGNVVGYQGAGAGRPIYQITINGQSQRIAITVGSNGDIVGANPTGSGK
jgi:filamentous hemagglutinin